MLRGYSSDEYLKVFPNTHRGIWSRAIKQVRPIEDTKFIDVTNVYPVLTFNYLTSLHIENKYNCIDLRDGLEKLPVTATFVTDPFLNTKYDQYFGYAYDVIREFKDHFFVDLRKPLDLPDNHKRNIKKSMKNTYFSVRNSLAGAWLRDSHAEVGHNFNWLYNILKQRHSIIGGSDFTEQQIYDMLLVPGTLVLEARDCTSETLLGMMIIYLEDNGKARYHLAAYSDYESKTTGFGLMYFAIETLKSLGYELLSIGASSGTVSNSDGLYRYKSGFSNMPTKKNYILFKIYNKEVYKELCKGKSGDFLPLYRS